MSDARTDAELFAQAQQGESEDDDLARAAIRELQRRGTREILDAARALLRSPTPRGRQRGADILGQLGIDVGGTRTFPTESVDALISAVDGENDPVVLEAIAVALGHNHDPRAVSALLPLQRHPSDEVRLGVVFGIMNYSAVRATPRGLERRSRGNSRGGGRGEARRSASSAAAPDAG